MNLSLLVYGSPYSTEAANSAYHFAAAALAAGHAIYRIFFYHDGVYSGNALSAPPQDEIDFGARWSQLAARHDIDLVVCVASALRRGVLDATEATRYEKPAGNLAPGFNISGLGQLAEACLVSDRVVTFGH